MKTKFLLSISLMIAALGVAPQASAAVALVDKLDRLMTNAAGEFEICWFGKADSETLPLRAKIESYFKAQFTDRAGFKFKFINDCMTAENPFFPVAIGFYDAHDNPEGLQNTMLGTARGHNVLLPGSPATYSRGIKNHIELHDMTLTSHFEGAPPTLVKQAEGLSEQGADNLRITIALHEFTHALGFDHEQNRPDSQCQVEQNYNPNIDVPLTEYDAHSVMNYCVTLTYDFEKGPIPLSDLDIVGLHALYSNK